MYPYPPYAIYSLGISIRVFSAIYYHGGIKWGVGRDYDSQKTDFEENVLSQVVLLHSRYIAGLHIMMVNVSCRDSRVSCVSFVAVVFLTLSYVCPYICLRFCLCRFVST